MLKSFRCNTYKKAGGGGVQRVHPLGVPQLAAAIPSSGASFNARERCAARDYRPRSVGCRMKLSTWLGNSPKYSVPTTVKAKTKFTVSGNPTGAADFASALDSRMYITTMTRR